MFESFTDLLNLPEELNLGMREVFSRLEHSEQTSKLDIPKIAFAKRQGITSIERSRDGIVISYGERVEAYKALVHVLANVDSDNQPSREEIRQRVVNICVMLDSSRNAVMKKERLQDWLCSMAMCGINQLMLYMEDTYELPGHEYFGYMRGRYSQADLREIDDYAHNLGIEIIPCIQTLAHLTRVLTYPKYHQLRENKSVLLPGSPDTVSFIDEMITAAAAPFRSKQIHIGMDEAWGLGRGRYCDVYGSRSCIDLFLDHLNDVLQICRKQNLKPMMWSDMFFRILSARGIHYDPDINWTEEVLQKIPDEIKQVYWNYYHSESSDYSHYIQLHKNMGPDVAVATGVQTWNRFWPAYEQTENTLAACFEAVSNDGVNDLIITLWGDDGTECDYFSAIPLLVRTGELNRAAKLNEKLLNAKTELITGYDYKSWKAPAELDCLEFTKKTGRASNWSKALLWDDPAYGLWTAQLEGQYVEGHYRNLVEKLKSLDTNNNDNFLFTLRLAKALAIKADLPTRLRAAYKDNDNDRLKSIAEDCRSKLLPLLNSLNHIHRCIWQKNNSIYGWEILERRYGGIKSCTENLVQRIEEYVSGQLDSLEELETKPLKNFDMDSSTAYLNSCAAVYGTGQIFHIMDE